LELIRGTVVSPSSRIRRGFATDCQIADCQFRFQIVQISRFQMA
jgi:hypothetical protein